MKRPIAAAAVVATALAGGLVFGARHASAQPATCDLAKYDLNKDGRVNLSDLNMWENQYETGNIAADLSKDGQLDKNADGLGLAESVFSEACRQLAGSTGLEGWPNQAPGVPDGIESLQVTGGPDTFGYTFRDQASAGCAANFVNIAATGTQIGSGDDSGLTVNFQTTLGAPAGTTFNMYGVNHAAVVASTNGFIGGANETNGGDLSNDCPIPLAVTGASDRIYVLHDDMYMEGGIARFIYAQYFATCPRQSDVCGAGANACTIVQWNEIRRFGTAGPYWTMQAILYHRTGEMVTQIASAAPNRTGGTTTGIQNQAGSIGLLYACNDTTGPGAPGPNNDSAVCYRHPTLSVTANCAAPPPPPPSVGGFDVGDVVAESVPAATTPAPASASHTSLLMLALVVGGAAAAAVAWGLRR